jgi:hypothetical protein
MLLQSHPNFGGSFSIYAPLQIGGGSGIFLVWRGNAPDYVDVPHNAAPVRLRFRFAQATPDTLRYGLRLRVAAPRVARKGEAWWGR